MSPTVLKQAAIAILSLAIVSAAQAQQAEKKKPRSRPHSAAQHQPLKPALRPRPTACAEFGPGFVRMPGSDSCIRFGGGVGIGVGAVP